MNIYCETNFFLEIVFSQEQSKYCEKIISLCRKKKVELIIPAYSFAESLYRLEGKRKERRNLRESLKSENTQLERTTQYSKEAQKIKDLEAHLVKIDAEDKDRLEKLWQDLTKISEIVPFNSKILQDTKAVESKVDLKLPDAIVLTSIFLHLQQNMGFQNCFLTKDEKGFSQQDIINDLKNLNCKFFTNFEKASNYIGSQIK